jgi:hypothetical protein
LSLHDLLRVNLLSSQKKVALFSPFFPPQPVFRLVAIVSAGAPADVHPVVSYVLCYVSSMLCYVFRILVSSVFGVLRRPHPGIGAYRQRLHRHVALPVPADLPQPSNQQAPDSSSARRPGVNPPLSRSPSPSLPPSLPPPPSPPFSSILTPSGT